ncbi:MAG: mechanosensitive ion channel family protein [Bacteroidia bacterium]
MIEGVPILFRALILFLVGYAVAKVTSVVISKTLKRIRIDDLAVKLKLDEPIRIIGVKGGLSEFIGKIIFWLIMLVVIVTVTDNLGIDILTEQVSKVLEFIPKLISAVLIMLVGYLIASKVREVLINITASLGGSAGKVLGNILYYFIMIMVVITSIDQMGVDTDLISTNILIIVAVILIAGAVAYGYAAREIMRNMLSSFYSKKNFYEGQRIKIGDLEGVILEIDSTSLILQVEGKKIIMPSTELMSNRVEVLDVDEQIEQ